MPAPRGQRDGGAHVAPTLAAGAAALPPGGVRAHGTARRRSCATVVGVLLSREHVAGTAHGEDAARRFRIVLDDGADARDVHVDRAVERLERMALERIHDLVAREDAAWALRQDDEQVELVTGGRGGLACERG